MARGESRAWVRLIATLTIWSVYGFLACRALGDAQGGERWPVALFVEGAIVSLLAQFGLEALTIFRRRAVGLATHYERDALIDGRATRLAYGALIATVVVVAIVSSLAVGIGLPVGDYRLVPINAWSPTAVMAVGLLAAVILAEVLKSAAALMLYRRTL